MLPLKRALAAEVGPLLCCLACGGKLSSTDAASDGAPSDSTDRVLTSADEALDMLASFEWGQHSSAYSAWFEFERRGWDGRVYGAFDFLDPLMPFKECVVRRTGNCVISDCGDWIA